ncbi:MAG: BlaI/MecI/CopY family transcriptional regulator [Bacteroidota bacterium]
MNDFQPTDAELEILQILWDEPASTIRKVHERINEQRDTEQQVGYTTISKQIERMTDKEVLQREKVGSKYLYTAIPQEEAIQQKLSDRLLRKAYKGSAVKLAMHALGQSKTTAEELEALQTWLNQQKNKEND